MADQVPPQHPSTPDGIDPSSSRRLFAVAPVPRPQLADLDIFGTPQHREHRVAPDWRDFLGILRRRRWPAFTVFLLVSVATVLHTFTQIPVPVYEAKARVLIESDQNVSGLKDPVEDRAIDQTQLMILQSRSVARKTMKTLGIWDQRAPGSTSRPEPGSFSALVVAIHDAAYGLVAYFSPPTGPTVTTEAGDPSGSAEETAKIDAFLTNLRVVPVTGTRLVDINYASTIPANAAAYANGIVTQFIQQNLEFKLLASKEVTDWLTDRLNDQRKALEVSEQALQNYRGLHKIVGLAEPSAVAVQRLMELSTALAKTRTERIEKEALFNQLQTIKGDRATLEAFPAVAANPAVQQLKSELLALQRQQSQMAETLGDRRPSLIKLREQVQAADVRLQAEIAKVPETLRTELAASRAAEASLSQALDTQRREAMAQNGSDVELVLLQHDAESNRQIWQSLQQRVNEFAVVRERRTSNIRVVDPAEVPKTPLGTGVPRDLRYGLLGALLLGVAAAFLLEYVDSHIKTPEQIQTDLKVPFLGLLPLVPREQARDLLVVQGAPESGRAGKPTSKPMPPSFGEALRKVRTNVRLSVTTDGMQRLLVTSPGAGEGKTVIASNLAATLAMSDHRVLLIDADLRRPRLHTVFGIVAEPGLSNLLAGTAPASACVRRTHIPGLSVLPSGTLPPNPSELLDSKRFKDFLAELSKYIDWVVIDSPPILPVTDALVLTQHVSGVLLVVSADLTPLQAARSAVEQLTHAKAHIFGAVLNRADIAHKPYYYRRYYRKDDENYYAQPANTA